MTLDTVGDIASIAALALAVLALFKVHRVERQVVANQQGSRNIVAGGDVESHG